MGRRPPRRRLRLTAWLAALLLAVSGCTPGPQSASGSLADRLNAALVAHSESDFTSNFTTDASGSALGATWFAVFSAGGASFTMLDPTTVRVEAAMYGDREVGTWILQLVIEGETPFSPGRIRAVEPTEYRPIWALGRTDVTVTRDGTLLSSGLDAAARSAWALRLEQAAEVVAAADPPGADGWNGGVVVDVPTLAADFKAITDESSSSAAAVTTCSAGTPRVVISPALLDAERVVLDATMVHEAVHVATNTSCGLPEQALPWAVEGLAESVAARAYPETAAANRRLIRDYLADHPLPHALPSDLRDLTDYALAQLAVDQVRAHAGSKADDLLDRGIHQAKSITPAELKQVTQWYLSALRRIAATR